MDREGSSIAGRQAELPDYLLRHYGWAYIWPPAVWFFEHQPIIDMAEPFLPSLWQQDLDRLVDACAQTSDKRAVRESRKLRFGGFYRVVRYRIQEAGGCAR